MGILDSIQGLVGAHYTYPSKFKTFEEGENTSSIILEDQRPLSYHGFGFHTGIQYQAPSVSIFGQRLRVFSELEGSLTVLRKRYSYRNFEGNVDHNLVRLPIFGLKLSLGAKLDWGNRLAVGITGSLGLNQVQANQITFHYKPGEMRDEIKRYNLEGTSGRYLVAGAKVSLDFDKKYQIALGKEFSGSIINKKGGFSSHPDIAAPISLDVNNPWIVSVTTYFE